MVHENSACAEPEMDRRSTTEPPAQSAARWAAYQHFKRGADLICTALMLVLVSPIFLLVALLVKREDHGPVFYRSRRIGLRGEEIDVLKFRTMKLHADRLEEMLTPEELEQYHREYKLDHDPRITRIGDFLRKSSVDELPQLINILRGDMSLVGPRPLVREELESKYDLEEQQLLLSVRPGLTGLWQVNGRSNCTYESGERQRLELLYIRRCSLNMDVKILFRTVGVVFRKIGAR